MLYVLFFLIAHIYNYRKFNRERNQFFDSLTNYHELSHREMILGHHFHIYIFELFFALMVAHLISEGGLELNLAGIGAVYIFLLGIGFGIYQFFLKYIEGKTGLLLRNSFNQYVVKEFRVSFALIMLPMLLYSLIYWAFLDEVQTGWGNYWLLGYISNFLFVSVVTILCTVIIMLRLIPNREITEPEYLGIINKHLLTIGSPPMRLRWIESDIKNAFVVGMKLFRFSNQTMFVGKKLRTMLTLEEFDAIIAHEIAHVANRHIQSRVIELLKNFATGIIGLIVIFSTSFLLFSIFYWEDAVLHFSSVGYFIAILSVIWFVVNYALFFDSIRSHEYQADAYAVIELGANLDSLKKALLKLTQNDMPEYIKNKIGPPKKKNWFIRLFSTHPEIKERIASLDYKVNHGLPFNFYVSPAQRIRLIFSKLFQWRISIPLAMIATYFILTTVYSIREGSRLITKVQNLSSKEIMNDQNVKQKINNRPMLIGPTLMAEIVKRRDPELLEYFIMNGANKTQTLYYLSQEKDYILFSKFYPRLQESLTEDEYYIVLSSAAKENFIEGFRLMVNSSKFDKLNPAYKTDITDITLMHKNQSRAPASIKK